MSGVTLADRTRKAAAEQALLAKGVRFLREIRCTRRVLVELADGTAQMMDRNEYARALKR